jgi:predicted signal transduction protein with EAL and GGDEF domain
MERHSEPECQPPLPCRGSGFTRDIARQSRGRPATHHSHCHRQAANLKIDRSFVSNIGKDPQASEIVRAVPRMSHAMEIRVNAEGVEQPGQIPILQEEGCEEVQGFLFGRPLPANQFAKRLACPAMTIGH